MKRLHGWTPRTYSYTRPDGLTVTTSDTEWDLEQRTLMAALVAWEADRCPCGCGQSLSECLTDTSIPVEQRPVWSAGFLECSAGRVLEAAMDRQAARDDEHAQRTGKRTPTRQRLWRVTRKDGGA